MVGRGGSSFIAIFSLVFFSREGDNHESMVATTKFGRFDILVLGRAPRAQILIPVKHNNV